ncbi:MAG TPA: hypothetical protein VFS97_03935 [Nitrososphaeraceae archaeon]|nr:hypothetical protein [Nitrososphaeraceae archaeon]
MIDISSYIYRRRNQLQTKPQEEVRLNLIGAKKRSSLPAVLDIFSPITSNRGELAEILLAI